MYPFEHFKVFSYQISSRRAKKLSKQLGKISIFDMPHIKTIISNNLIKILSGTKVATSSIKMLGINLICFALCYKLKLYLKTERVMNFFS